jgi:hypothetical protein
MDPASAAPMLADLGFLARPNFRDPIGSASLLVALREAPTLRHYDPEVIEYWVSDSGRGVQRTLTRLAVLPIDTDFSWGLIRIVDRLHVTNEYLTFGGHLLVDAIDGVVIAVFTSPAPLLRRGGHSQGWDEGAESLGAFFSRLLLAVDYVPGFEGEVARADPVTRYGAFLGDAIGRYRDSARLRAADPDFWAHLLAEERRLAGNHREALAAGADLRRLATR